MRIDPTRPAPRAGRPSREEPRGADEVRLCEARAAQVRHRRVTVATDRALGAAGQDLDQKTGGTLSRAMKASRFTGKKEETLAILAPAGVEFDRVLLVGIGKGEDLSEAALQASAAPSSPPWTVRRDRGLRPARLPDGGTVAPDAAAAELAFGAQLRSYRFDKYRTTEKKEAKPSLKKIIVLTAEPDAAKRAYGRLEPLAESVAYTAIWCRSRPTS
ncbi:M17 family peptidase N-terminal domain-containing protein [Azospirillum brasilense]|uniref:M17 family peptidase N-terminal domain-containing protein n=1 Tax=Azospirillum brasilense TaxID=192 RepID=UPI001FFED6AA|nr:M17 family peptidase N-terminal domain-containing protein [Azospirillum brasilense]